MKNRVDLSEQSEDKYQQYRALVINKPTWNMTGEYTCNVDSFSSKSNDKKGAYLQIIGKI